ncbi:MAG: alpha/beta hydrolase [Pseudomonadota bacterium]
MQPSNALVQPLNDLESVCTFGKDAQLAGIYTPSRQPDSGLPCALFLTAGLLHHVGPHRFYVEMARDLAKIGASSLRFDLAGVGDSETRSGGSAYAQRSVEDIKIAMDHLFRVFGHREFVLIGLCSGADDALATALKDRRVVGAVLLNGYAYRAGHFLLYRLLNFYLPRLFMWQKWRNRLAKLFGRTLPDPETAASMTLDDDYRYIPPQSETAQNISTLTQEGAQLLFVYTGSEHEEYTYKGQLFDMFPTEKENARLREHFLKGADHTLVLKKDRQQLSQWIQSWFRGVPFKREH